MGNVIYFRKPDIKPAIDRDTFLRMIVDKDERKRVYDHFDNLHEEETSDDVADQFFNAMKRRRHVEI